MSALTGVNLRAAFRLCHRSTEFRAIDDPDGDGRTLEGYAAVFDQPTIIESYAGDFEETVSRGAFKKTLQERTPVMQFDHGNDKAVGTAPIAGIQELQEDGEGLLVRARLLDTPRVEDIRQAIRLKAIRGMSFKFRVVRDRWIDRDGTRIPDDDLADMLEDPGDRGPIRRQITEVELFELGPVVFPAYAQTTVGVRSLPEDSRFNPNALAVRGILSQFGLTERCVHRHLQSFNSREREVLAAEIGKTFPELRQLLERTVVPSHDTPTVEGTWDAGANERRLPSPMPLATARRMYAWYDGSRVEDGEVVKDACSLPHHVVSEDGTPGAANLNGVRNALSRLPQSDIPESDHERIRAHLRNHLPSGEDDEASSDAAPSSTSENIPDAAVSSTSGHRSEPAAGHSDYFAEVTDWYLPDPSENL